MAVPLQADIDKKEKFKLSLEKKLVSGDGKLSEKQMCTILRSNVRQTWFMSPIRLLKLELARIPDLDPKTRTKWLCDCEHCGARVKMSDVEVDHIKGEHPLKSLSDIEQFAKSILDVTLDDLQVICKPCHEIKTYSERYGITFEEAKLEKEVVAWLKKTKTTEQKTFLESRGFTSSELSNGDKRRDAYRKYLSRGE